MRVTREMTFHAWHSHHGMMVEPKHDHIYTVGITLEGEPNEDGFVADFRALKRIFNRVVGKYLEGSDLDERFEYATSENLACWIWDRLIPFFPLFSIEIREKPHSKTLYFGPKRKPI